jgi:hypothetical protein
MRTRLLICLAALAICAGTLAAQAALNPSASQDPHWQKAIELRGQSVAAYDAGDYDLSSELARQAKAELALMKAPAAAPEPAPQPAPVVADTKAPLPASYTVRLIPGDRDCLSKIAGYPFIYGDRAKWPLIYRANKATLKHPENADIILPGEVLVIPSIAGESRDGEWSADKEYPDFAAQK